MNNEELLNSQVRQQTIADINREMANIANLARAYANATPEQRNNVNIQDIQAQMDRYNQLKQQRSDLYAQQEVDFQKQLEANRIAQANTNLNTRGAWRVVRNNPPIVTETVVEEVATPATTPINVWQYSSWWNPINAFWWRMWINMDNLNNNHNGVVYTNYPNNLSTYWSPVNLFNRGFRSNFRSNYWLNNPWSFYIDQNGNYRELWAWGNITTTYNNWLRSDAPGSFSLNGNWVTMVDNNWNLVRRNTL